MNWRILVGLLLLMIGVGVWFTASKATGGNVGMAKVGSVIWMLVGLFLLIKSMTQQKEF